MNCKECNGSGAPNEKLITTKEKKRDYYRITACCPACGRKYNRIERCVPIERIR